MMERCTCLEPSCEYCSALEGEPLMGFAQAVAIAIASQRGWLGLSRSAIAQRAGVHHNTVVSAENKQTDIYLGTLEKIAHGLGITIGELLELAERTQYGLEE